MRLLLVDPSPLTALVFRLLVPADVDVERVETLDAALDTLRQDPPEAAFVDVTRPATSWATFFDLCQQHRPPIPFLISSSIHRGPVEAGLRGVEGSCFMAMPSDLEALKGALADLFDAVEIDRWSDRRARTPLQAKNKRASSS